MKLTVRVPRAIEIPDAVLLTLFDQVQALCQERGAPAGGVFTHELLDLACQLGIVADVIPDGSELDGEEDFPFQRQQLADLIVLSRCGFDTAESVRLLSNEDAHEQLDEPLPWDDDDCDSDEDGDGDVPITGGQP